MISNAVKELQSAKKQLITQINGLEQQTKKIDQAVAALSGLTGTPEAKPAKKFVMSPAHRKALIKAQKARWAKHNVKTTAKAPVAKPAKKKYKMSAAAKAKLSAFQKARWAKINATKKK